MFAFARSIPDDAPATNRGIPEVEKRGADDAAARSEHERVRTNWIECKVSWSKLHSKRELNSQPNEITIDAHDYLWGTNMKTLMDHLIEESGEQWKFAVIHPVNLVS